MARMNALVGIGILWLAIAALMANNLAAPSADAQAGVPVTAPPGGTYHYIRPDGNDSAAGASWATAWKTIDRLTPAYPAAFPYTDGDTIVVRYGTYTPTRTTVIANSHVAIISEERAVTLGFIPKDPGYLEGKPIIDGQNIATGNPPGDPHTFDLDSYGVRNRGIPNDVHGFTLDGFELVHTSGTAHVDIIRASCYYTISREYNKDHTVRYCYFHDTYGEAIFARRANNFHIHDCTFYKITPGEDQPNQYLHHVIYLNECDRFVVEDNLIHDSASGGAVHLNGDCATPTGDGVHYYEGFVADGVVRRNRFYSCQGTAIAFYNAIGGRCENNVIYNPVYTTDHINDAIYVGWDVKTVEAPEPSTGVVICNNTLIRSATQNDGIRLGEGLAKNCQIFNNIIVSANGVWGDAIHYGANDNHTVSETSNKVVPYSTTNLTNWFTDGTNENLALRDFSLRSGSPFQDAGISTSTNSVSGTVYAPRADYAGTARPQGPRFDVGAYECVSGSQLRGAR